MRPILDFDDAGALDDEPAKGVTVGDIRAWHDEIERLKQEYRDLEIEAHEDYQALEAQLGKLGIK